MRACVFVFDSHKISARVRRVGLEKFANKTIAQTTIAPDMAHATETFATAMKVTKVICLTIGGLV
jgi:hypothetical protein